MKKHLKFHLVWGFTVAALLLAQIGCSSKSAENASTAQPAASPNNAAALTTASPAADATSTAAGNPGAAGAGASGGSSAAPANPSGAASSSVGASASSPAGAGAAAPAPAPTPRVYTIRAGSPIAIYTAKTLSTKTDKDGERFIGSLARPIVDDDWVIAKKGAQVEGVVVNSDPGGRVKGRASMTVRLRSLQLADGSTISLSSSSYTKVAKGTKKKDALKIGIGAGIGAAIGAIAGGGKGAAIGAGAGGGAGTGLVLATRGDPAVIPSESLLTFRLQTPITVTKR